MDLCEKHSNIRLKILSEPNIYDYTRWITAIRTVYFIEHAVVNDILKFYLDRTLNCHPIKT